MRRPATLLLVIATVLGGCASSPVTVVEDFRACRDAGDLDAARAYLTDDPRVWYGERTGEGSPWKLGAGRWKTWDDHFNSSGEVGDWHVEDGSVWAIVDVPDRPYVIAVMSNYGGDGGAVIEAVQTAAYSYFSRLSGVTEYGTRVPLDVKRRIRGSGSTP